MERSERGTPVSTVDQRTAWNGPEGESWAERPRVLPADGDLTDLILEAADPEWRSRILDIGCGTGGLTRQLAGRAAGGVARGVDLSELMVRRARADAEREGVTNVVFEVGDAEVHPLEPGSHDLAVSHFGSMFFADPVAAFSNITRGLRAGGRLVIVVPRQMSTCDWYVAPLEALTGRLPTEGEAPSAMFSLADPDHLRATLVAAGLDRVELTQVDRSLWFGADVGEAVDAYVGSGPVRAALDRDPALTQEEAGFRLGRCLSRYLGPDGVRVPGSHWLAEARRPGGPS